MAVSGDSLPSGVVRGTDADDRDATSATGGGTDDAVRVENAPDPTVSFVVPALNEASYLPATLRSIAGQVTDRPYEAVVVDGGSDDDTVLRDHYVETMLKFVRRRDLAAASSRCRISGLRRAAAMEWTLNYAFPHLDRPILPGFNLFVDRRAYFDAGGFSNVPNEDTAFSRRLARIAPTDYCPRVLVESSGRRSEASGLTGTLAHYLWLDAGRLLRSVPDRRR